MATAKLSGGDKLQARLAELAQKVSQPGTLQVGFFENATYPDTGTKVAMVAAIHEFGAPKAGIPSRPFFRRMIAKNSSKWGPAIGAILKANGYNARNALEVAGLGIEEQLKQAIIDFVGVPLKPATIARKGFSKQLIETGHMKDSVTHKVVA